ncbi:NAD(P)H-binding protein [Chitinispirillales bacterium ANBcel5]|uniref:NmrA family NAD(P)-binding protein n=1 Tax=Cellulosispirillum alkaliphilum TaxID=3039283 RepID=UPI002A560A18|nr:NAD(P)H-binding protein [Chitinispirillales bacterium ANBcel5]
MILITDVSSRMGSHLAMDFLKSGQKVRGIDESRGQMARLISEGLDAATGQIDDPVFLSSTFEQVESVFFIIPLHANREDSYRHYFINLANTMTKVVRESAVRNIFLISSMGADEKEEAGFLSAYGEVEEILDTLELETITLIRPGYFMDHLLPKISMIRTKDMIGDVINGDTPLYFTSIKDVASTITTMYQENSFFGRSKVELYSDKMSLRRAVKIIGEYIDIPELPFVQMGDQEYRNHLLEEGASISFANMYTEMAHAISRGAMVPALIDPQTPNLPTRVEEFIENVFVPAYKSGSEEL